LIFYDYWRSSSGWRVRIALNIKQISVERRPVNLAPQGDVGAQHSADFRALNPMSQVPVLVIEGPPGPPRTLTQSMAILEYLEERFPAPPLLPADPWLRGRARQLGEMVNAGIQPMQNLSFLQRLHESGLAEPKQVARHHIARGLGAIEAAAGETAGTFLVGDAPTIADLYLVPQLYSGRRFNVDLSVFPRLLQIEAACAALPAFTAAHPDAQPDVPVVSKS
jgi:maleylacetoacetate isomerase